MELCHQPARQHGKPVGAYEERDHQQPHAVADGIHEDDEQTEEAENGGGDAEDAAGQADDEHEKPCDDGKHREDGRKQKFQKKAHLFFLHSFCIVRTGYRNMLHIARMTGNKKAGAAYLAASRPAWDKYPFI